MLAKIYTYMLSFMQTGENHMSFPENLKRLMAERNWRNVHMTVELEKAGYLTTSWAVDRWLEGLNSPRFDAVPYLAKVFDVSADELFGPTPDTDVPVPVPESATAPGARVMTREEVIDAVAKRNFLSGANLSCADLSCADLRFTNLSGANLSGADLRFTNLSGAN